MSAVPFPGHGLPPRLRVLSLLVAVLGVLGAWTWTWPGQALAAPGLCVGPMCAEEITRSAKHHWQLRLRVNDQQGRHERLVVDCRDGHLSPVAGTVERGYAAAVARRACRLAGEAPPMAMATTEMTRQR